jgi:hypothetical protein
MSRIRVDDLEARGRDWDSQKFNNIARFWDEYYKRTYINDLHLLISGWEGPSGICNLLKKSLVCLRDQMARWLHFIPVASLMDCS